MDRTRRIAEREQQAAEETEQAHRHFTRAAALREEARVQPRRLLASTPVLPGLAARR